MNIMIQSAFQTTLAQRALIAQRLWCIEAFPRKAMESAALFVVMGMIYSVYLKALWSIPACTEVELNLSLVPILLKFLVFTGWPFALMAWLDETWTSKDAGRVFLVVFSTANLFWMHRYHHAFCPFSFATEMFPYVFGASVAHTIGLSASHSIIKKRPRCSFSKGRRSG